MVWIALYSAIAMVVATAAFIAAEWLRTPAVPAPERLGVVAAAAGLLWPVLAAGLVQLGLFAVIRARLREQGPPAVRQPARIPDTVAR